MFSRAPLGPAVALDGPERDPGQLRLILITT